jgi:hypothetical protein
VCSSDLSNLFSRYFAVETTQQRTPVYEVVKVGMDREGIVTVNAREHPVDAAGFSLLTRNWTTYGNDQNWSIEF